MQKKQVSVKKISPKMRSLKILSKNRARQKMVQNFRTEKNVQQRTKRKNIRLDNLAQWFLPTAENSLRPHALGRRGLFLLAAVLLIFNFAYLLARDSGILGKTTEISRDNLLAATNDARAKSGLKNLRENSKLNAAAEQKARDMFAKNYWSHDAPDGKTPWKFLADENYSYASAGENLARGFSRSDSVIAAWLDSPTHRENVLATDFSEIGFAVERGIMDGKMTTLVVALYAMPTTSFANNFASGEVLGATKIGEILQKNDFLSRIARAASEKNPFLIATLAILLIATIWLIALHFLHHRAAKFVARPVRHAKFVAKLGVFAILTLSALAGYGGGMLI